MHASPVLNFSLFRIFLQFTSLSCGISSSDTMQPAHCFGIFQLLNYSNETLGKQLFLTRAVPAHEEKQVCFVSLR